MKNIHVALLLSLCLLSSGASAQEIGSGEPAVDSALRIDELIQKTNADPSDAGAWTQLGILYIDEGMLPEARDAFISALQAAPQEPSSHLNLAVCLVRMEKWQEAMAPLQSYRQLAPDDVRGWALGGQVLAEHGQLDEGVRVYLEGIGVEGMPVSDQEILLGEATSALLHKKEEGTEPSEAELRRVGEILDRHTDLVEGADDPMLRDRRDYAWLELAKRQEAAGAHDQALESWAHLRKTGSTNPTAWVQPVQLLIDEGRLDEAGRLAREAGTALPGAATVPFLEGRIADAKNQPQEAARAYRKAAEIDPELPGVWSALGEALAKSGDSRGASEALAEAVARGQGGAAAAYNMGVVLNQKNQFREAIPYLEDAVEADPANRDAYRALGTAYRKTERFQESADTYAALIDRFGPDSGDLYQLAFAEAKVGDNAKAAGHYEMVTVMEPTNVNAFYGLGNARSKEGKYGAAAAAYEAALGLKPDYHAASFGWALALQKKGDYEAAIERYELTLEIKETYASYVNMAICYQNLGDEETSNEYYALANELKKGGR